MTRKKKVVDVKAEKKGGAGSDAEDLGTVKRLLQRVVTDADKASVDVQIHGLLDARDGVERQIKRAKRAASKLKTRFDEITAQVAELHKTWKEPEIVGVVECRVERSPTELRLVRLDTNDVAFRRALTREEHEALGAQLPHMPDAPRIVHPEMQPDDEVTDRIEKDREEAAKRDELMHPITLEDVFDALDEDGEGDEDEHDAPTEKRPRKSKRAVNQQELPLAGDKR